ncbi:glycine cleavage system protein T [Halarchaeum grantii]|uniref:Probable aminomethyltransferase n=1 Tax=Halarchaeum grantii TaxID=1193105 RepID=A0A830F6J2_9EURY|nr:glycine cleavage system aminomethyltransferase GcvT [Halarchaeum grantii]GGL25032.1 glycine cleavage system protein T [Halarchaeum grantii]
MASRTTPLHDRHAEAGATFTDFGGWEMPVEFDGIRDEHAAVREGVGVFDVSHMGEVEVSGPEALELVSRMTTNDASHLDPGDAQYALQTDEEGVIVDDTLVYLLPDGETYLFVPNAGHDAEAVARWRDHRDAWGLDAAVENVSDERGMLAVQGPDAVSAVADETTADVEALGRFEAANATVAGVDCLVSRTGYTGEDGVELVFETGDGATLWDAFVPAYRPCGLGARDTLRTEMGFLLSGQDFHHEENPRTPFEAGVGFAVDLDHAFVGRDALVAQAAGELAERFTGLVLEERGVPRHGYAVTADADAADRIGELTSGTMSPTRGEPIGLGYLDAAYADPGTTVYVVIRGEAKRATITEPPFIDR